MQSCHHDAGAQDAAAPPPPRAKRARLDNSRQAFEPEPKLSPTALFPDGAGWCRAVGIDRLVEINAGGNDYLVGLNAGAGADAGRDFSMDMLQASDMKGSRLGEFPSGTPPTSTQVSADARFHV